jgi:hypothetical protein
MTCKSWALKADLQTNHIDTCYRDQLYFDRAYAFAPILQAHRYRSWSKLPNKSKQKTCLQHAMWTLASSLSSQFQVASRQLYAETRQLLHTLESEEPSYTISIEQAQAWTLLAIYELTCEDYQRGMMSAGRAFRLIQMMRLYEVDAPQTPPAGQSPEQDQAQLGLQGHVQENWIDQETKRRTFWLAYTLDRFTSMVDGMHLFFDERMVSLTEESLGRRSIYLLPARSAPGYQLPRQTLRAVVPRS